MEIASNEDKSTLAYVESLTPRQVVEELDKFIVGQAKAKRAVAVALRNRYRRARLAEDLRDEVIPKNILMIGPTGVGKTEIARRLAKLARAPFLKVEATKFTEVGYVGRDVDSMVRDLVQISYRLVEAEMKEAVREQAEEQAVERIVEILQPRRTRPAPDVAPDAGPSVTPGGKTPQEQFAEFQQQMARLFGQPFPGAPPFPGDAPGPSMGRGGAEPTTPEQERPAPASDSQREEVERKKHEQEERIRARLREQVAGGSRDGEEIEVEVEEGGATAAIIPLFGAPGLMGPGGADGSGMEPGGGQGGLGELLGQMLPKRKKSRRVTIAEAKRLFTDEIAAGMVDRDAVGRGAVERAEQAGVIFIDEIDKVAGRGGAEGRGGPDVSREGVQRDLLPIIEGSTVQTRYGAVRTNHMLFIAAGAFHVSRPSDLIPELQGRLPIRVELENLVEDDFRRILTEPRTALTRQYAALLATEGLAVEFTDDAIREVARIAVDVNTRTENIGARRLHTVMERLLEELSFEAPEAEEKRVVIDAAFVRDRLSDVADDEDLSRYIL